MLQASEMLKFSKTFLFLSAVITLAEGQQKPYTKFTDTLVVQDKVIYTSRWTGIETENFIYAVCNEPNFEYRHCNVTIQKEAQKRTCSVRLAPTDSNKKFFSIMSHLSFYAFNDDKVIITWPNYVDLRWKASHFKILDISTCELIDVRLPAAEIIYVIANKDAVNLGFRDKNYCGSKHCKITVNTDGKIISGPTEVLNGVDVAYIDPLGPVSQHASDQGFYAAVGLNSEFGHGHSNDYFYKIDGRGRSEKFMTFEGSKHARASVNNDLFSFCYMVNGVNSTVGCIQYDKTLNLKLNTSLDFEDGHFRRWLQPYNLKKGGLLLVTGRTSDLKGKRYDSFSIIKIHQDGKKDKAIEFDDLNFTGPFIGIMDVNVLEKESGELCVHFSCTHDKTDNEGIKTVTLQLAIKCLSKA